MSDSRAIAARIISEAVHLALGTGKASDPNWKRKHDDDELLGDVDGYRSWQTGSTGISLMLDGAVSGGIAAGPSWAEAGIGVGPTITINGNFDIPDDRQFKPDVNCKIAIKSLQIKAAALQAKAALAKVAGSSTGDGPANTVRAQIAAINGQNDALSPMLTLTGELGTKGTAELGGGAVTGEAGATGSVTRFHKRDNDDKIDPNGRGAPVVATSIAAAAKAGVGFAIPVVGVGASGSVTTSWIRGHPNADNDGDYVTFSLSLDATGAIAQGVMGAVIPLVERGARTKATSPVDLWEKLRIQNVAASAAQAAANGSMAAASLASGPLGDISPVKLESKLAAVLDLNYVRVGHEYLLQYARLNRDMELKAGVEGKFEFAPGGAAGGAVELAATNRRAVLERLGTGTFSYVQTVFNGLMKRNNPAVDANEGDGTRAWNDFRDHHEVSLAKLCVRLTNDGKAGPLYGEIDKINGHNRALFKAVSKCRPLPADPDVQDAEILRWFRSNHLAVDLKSYLNDARADHKAKAKVRFKPYHKGSVKLIGAEQWEDDGRYARATIMLDEDITVDRKTQYDELRAELGEKTLLELATEHNFPIDVTIHLALAGYHIQFRTETQMVAQIEKYTRSNLEHRQWLIIQLSDTKLKDLYPGYKLK
jgi:hypothetical protein